MALEFLLNNRVYAVEIKESQNPTESPLTVRIGDKDYQVDYRQLTGSLYSLIMDGRSHQVTVTKGEGGYEVYLRGKTYPVQILDEAAKRLRVSKRGAAASGQQTISAPMPGKVLKLLVKVGDSIQSGQGIVVVEAMKMENEIRSSAPGMVKEIKVSEGNTVNAGEVLVVLGTST
jgi:biotin carboxyl carrier protein